MAPLSPSGINHRTSPDSWVRFGQALPFIAWITFVGLFFLDQLSITAPENFLSYVVVFGLFACLSWIVWVQRKLIEQLYKRLEELEPVTWGLFLLLGIFVTEAVFTGAFARRLVFMFWFAHLLPVLFPPMTRIWKKSGLQDRISLALVAIVAILLILPGAYFPPFFNGIGGWVVLQEDGGSLRLPGYKFMRDDGEMVWITAGITPPTSLQWRQITAAQGASEEAHAAYLDFVFSQYKRAYPLLARGYYPNQQYLGAFAYPGHNPYPMLNYADFPPKRIKEIVYIDETYERPSMRLVLQNKRWRYDPWSQKFVE